MYTFTHKTRRYVFWVAKYAHLCAMYFDYLLMDGSHGISKHGWKYIPLCIKTSGGSIVPICAVWGLEEDTASMLKMLDLVRGHLLSKGVNPIAFAPRLSPQVTLVYTFILLLIMTDCAFRNK